MEAADSSRHEGGPMHQPDIIQVWNFLIICISSSNACNLSSSTFTKLHKNGFVTSVEEKKKERLVR